MDTPIGNKDINEKCPDQNPSTSQSKTRRPNAIKASTLSSVVCQHAPLEAILFETGQHPYKLLQCMLGDALVMLHSAETQSTKPRCVETVKTAANYIKRIHRIHRSLFKAGAADPQYPCTPVQINEIKGYIRWVLKKAGERLTLNKSLTNSLTLHGIKEIIKEPTELIAEARGQLANFIAEDKGGISK